MWEETLAVLERLVDAGFMVNTKKSHFLVSSLKTLGYQLVKGVISPVFTQLEALVQSNRAPRTVLDVCQLYGLLLYFCTFIPHFA